MVRVVAFLLINKETNGESHLYGYCYLNPVIYHHPDLLQVCSEPLVLALSPALP